MGYNHGVSAPTSQETRLSLPDTNLLSVVMAAVLLAYAATPFINIPPVPVRIPLPGILLAFMLDLGTISSFLAAALAGLGADWLARTHPRFEEHPGGRHWLLPALAAWVVGVPLSNLEFGLGWWAVFSLGGLLVALVLAAEYIAVDLNDVRHGVASAGLIAVSFALFLTLAVALRASGLRLFLVIPALSGAAFVLALRTLYLRLGARWEATWAFGIALVTGQLAAAIFYWPLLPLQYGLILLGVVYALTVWAVALLEERGGTSAWLEPAAMLVVLWLLAALIRR